MLRPPPRVQPPASVITNPYFDQMRYPPANLAFSGEYKPSYSEKMSRDEPVDRDYPGNSSGHNPSYSERMPRDEPVDRDYPGNSSGHNPSYSERMPRDAYTNPSSDIPFNSSTDYRKTNETPELSEFEKDVMYEMMKLDAALKSELELMEKNQSTNKAVERTATSDVMMPRANTNTEYNASNSISKLPNHTPPQSVQQTPNNPRISNVFNSSPNFADYGNNLSAARRKGSGINSLYKAPSEENSSSSKMLYAQQLQQQIEEQKRLKSLDVGNYSSGNKGKHGEIIDYKYSPGYDPSTLPPPSATLLQDMYGMNSGGMVFGHDQNTEKSLRREKQDMYKKQLDEIVSTRDHYKQQYTPNEISSTDRHMQSRDQYKQEHSAGSVDNNVSSVDSMDKAARRKQQQDYRLLLDQQIKSNKEMSEAARPYPDQEIPSSVSKAYTHATPSPTKKSMHYDDRHSQSGMMNHNYHDGGASISSELDAEHNYHGMLENNQPSMILTHDVNSGGKGVAKSPTKARLRLIADVYGSAGSAQVLGQSNTPSNGVSVNWKPSGKNQDDRKKAAVLEQKAILENQIADTKRRKEEEARQMKMQDEELERRVRSELASAGEEERRMKEMRRTQMRDEINQAKAINDKAFADARARKGKLQENTGNVQNTPPRVLQMNQPVQNSPPIYSSVTKTNHIHSLAHNSPPTRAVHPPPKVSNTDAAAHYYSHNPSANNIQYIDQDYHKPNPLNTSISNGPNELSYSLSHQRTALTMEPVYQQNQRSLLHSSNESLHNFRPNSAEEVDSFLVNWQSRNNPTGRVAAAPFNRSGSYHAGDFSMSASYRPSVFSGLEATDVSFVSESRLVSANPWDSVGLMSSLAPAGVHKDNMGSAVSQDVTSNRKKFTANDELEESLASDSLLMFIGDRTPLKTHVTAPSVKDNQVNNTIVSPLSRLISQSNETKVIDSRKSNDRPISARPLSISKPSPKSDSKVNDSLDRIISSNNNSYSEYTEMNEEESEIIVARNTSLSAMRSPEISRITPNKPSNYKVQTPTKEEYDAMNSTLTSPPRSPPRVASASPGSSKSKYQSSVLNEYFANNNRPVSSTKSRWDTSDSTKEVTLSRLNHVTSTSGIDEDDDEEAIQISYTSKGQDSVQDSYYQDTFEEDDS